MRKKFLSIIALVSVVSLHGMDSDKKKYEEEMTISYRQAEAALERARARKDTLLDGLTEMQLGKTCKLVGDWAVVGMTKNSERLPRENKDYDKYLLDALKVEKYKSHVTFVCGTCGNSSGKK